MTFARTDTQQMIADMVERLLTEENEFEARRRRLAATPPDRMALWPKFAELGVIGAAFAEAVGGFGGSARDVAVVQHAIGRSLAVEPFLATVVSGRVLLAADGDDRARQEIEAILGGGRVVVLAHGEGFDPFATPGVEARQDGDAVRLTGVKQVVRHADVADAFIVTARNDGHAGCFLVERRAEGVVVEDYRLMDAAGAGTLRLEGANAAPLVTGDAAAAAIADAVEWGIVGMAAEAAGMLAALNAVTREYLRTRVQFGAPIGSFQALQHRSADMFIAGEEATIATDAVLDAFEAGPGKARSARVSALKVIVDKAGRKVGHEAVQLHGGMGVSDELIVSHYMRRLATMRAELGGAEIHRSRFRALAA